MLLYIIFSILNIIIFYFIFLKLYFDSVTLIIINNSKFIFNFGFLNYFQYNLNRAIVGQIDVEEDESIDWSLVQANPILPVNYNIK